MRVSSAPSELASAGDSTPTPNSAVMPGSRATRPFADARAEDVRAGQRGLMSARLAQQRARSLAVALYQGVFGELAQVVGRDPPALELHGRGQLVKHLERLGPVALGLVDAYQVIECGVTIFARGRELLEHALGAIHEPRALIVQRQGECRLVARARATVIAQARMDGDRTIDLAAAPEQAPERELDLGGITVGLGHAGEDLRGVVETVVDEMVEADVVVARQAHGARRAVTAAEKIGGETDEDEGQRQQQWRQLEHLADDIRSAPRLRLAPSRIGRLAPAFIRSRRSLPGLLCGACSTPLASAYPVLGLRPWRGGRKCSEKLPKPRISMRSPCDSASLMISRICFSASPTSFAGRCFCLAVMISMSSDLVMRSALSGTDLVLQQVPEAGTRRRRFRAVALHRLGLFVSLLGLDRQRDGARLAVDTGELRLDL